MHWWCSLLGRTVTDGVMSKHWSSFVFNIITTTHFTFNVFTKRWLPFTFTHSYLLIQAFACKLLRPTIVFFSFCKALWAAIRMKCALKIKLPCLNLIRHCVDATIFPSKHKLARVSSMLVTEGYALNNGGNQVTIQFCLTDTYTLFFSFLAEMLNLLFALRHNHLRNLRKTVK